jgi:hypothetical protein
VNNGWRDRAACAGKDTAWWLADPSTDPAAVYLARTICATCPVRPDCAAEALAYLDADELYGCWAGVNVHARSARTQLRILAQRIPQD